MKWSAHKYGIFFGWLGDSLTDALIRTYKNSGHLEFWESHLENIYYCHRTLMGCSSTIPMWPLRSNGLSKNTCAKVFNFDETPPVVRSGPKNGVSEFSKQRHRIHLAHERNLVLRDIFEEDTGIDIQSLEPHRDFNRKQPAKKRKLGRKEKRLKLDSNEERGKKRQDSMHED